MISYTFWRSRQKFVEFTKTILWHFPISYDQDKKSRQMLPVCCWYIFSALWNIKHFHISCCFYDFTADFRSAVTAPINGQWWPNYWAVEGAAQFKRKRVIKNFKKICCYLGRDRKSSQFFINCFFLVIIMIKWWTICKETGTPGSQPLDSKVRRTGCVSMEIFRNSNTRCH